MAAWQPGHAVGRGDDPGVDDTEAKAGNPFGKGGNPFGKGKNDKPVEDGDKTPGKLKCRFCTVDATKRVRRADMPKGMGVCDKHVALARAAGKRVLGVDDLTKEDGDGDKPKGKPEKKASPADMVQRKAAPRRAAAPRFAGLAILAADTGRVLMLQRAIGDPKDPAAGTWEFPGGGIEDKDESTLHGAMREWAEEVGRPVPTGGTVAYVWTSPNGIYQGHALVIPEESGLDLSGPRTVDNPDDDTEQVAWWSLDHAQKNPALRPACRSTPWRELARVAGEARRAGKLQKKEAPRDPAARQARLAGQAATEARAAAASDGKRRVSSARGEARYGLPMGAEIGKARDRKAEEIQKDPRARESYEKLLTANPREYRKMLDGLSDDELGRLTQVAYSFRSSNANVVQARLALAGALRRRGKDVADYGGLGARATSNAAAAPRREPVKPPPERGNNGARRLSAAEDGSASYSDGTVWDPEEQRFRQPKTTKSLPRPDGTWLPGEAWRDRAERRTVSGLMGKALPPPDLVRYGEGGQPMQLHVYGDGSWQYKGGGSGELVTSSGYRADADPIALAAVIEAKVMSPDPGATRLREYWAHGAGRRKWRPGSKGDFKRLRRQLARHVPAHVLNGLTANIHKLATGEWPGRNAHGSKAAPGGEWSDLAPEDLIEATMLDPSDPTGRGADDDAISTALDRYADIAGQLTAEEEYEAALAREVVWDLMSDGSVLAQDAGLEVEDSGGWYTDDPDDEPDPVAMLTDLYADSP